jgi:hypothetical protein
MTWGKSIKEEDLLIGNFEELKNRAAGVQMSLSEGPEGSALRGYSDEDSKGFR